MIYYRVESTEFNGPMYLKWNSLYSLLYYFAQPNSVTPLSCLTSICRAPLSEVICDWFRRVSNLDNFVSLGQKFAASLSGEYADEALLVLSTTGENFLDYISRLPEIELYNFYKTL